MVKVECEFNIATCMRKRRGGGREEKGGIGKRAFMI